MVGFLPTLYSQAGWGGARGAVLTALVAAVNMSGNIAAGRLLHRGVRPQALLWTGFGAMALGAWLAFSGATAELPALRYAGALLFSSVGGLIPGTLFALAPTLAPGRLIVGYLQDIPVNPGELYQRHLRQRFACGRQGGGLQVRQGRLLVAGRYAQVAAATQQGQGQQRRQPVHRGTSGLPWS